MLALQYSDEDVDCARGFAHYASVLVIMFVVNAVVSAVCSPCPPVASAIRKQANEKDQARKEAGEIAYGIDERTAILPLAWQAPAVQAEGYPTERTM